LLAALRLKLAGRGTTTGWSLAAGGISLLVLVPLLVVLVRSIHGGPEWAHVVDTVLWGYVGNTAWLTVAVGLVAAGMAIPGAWLVATTEFPGRRHLEWALALPLAIPTYVAAFTYYPLLTDAIPLLVWVRSEFGVDAFLLTEKILRQGLLTLLLAGVLYPYVYLTVRVSFARQRRAVIEASRTLGASMTTTFWRVALPLARPAIVAGLGLVVMEVINDYGAVHFFGVPTLTEGIFRTWFGLQDRDSAVRLAGLVLVAVLVLLAAERRSRGQARFDEVAATNAPLTREPLEGGLAWTALLVCLLPLVIGFFYPVGRLVTWAWWTFADVMDATFLQQAARSVSLAFVTAVVLAGAGLVLSFAVSLSPSRGLRAVRRLATLGYAVPGAVIAMGVMTTFGALDRGQSWVVFSGTLFAISCAYVVRFLAVANQPIEAGFDRLGQRLGESSFMLGHGPTATLWRIHLPLLRGTLIAAAMLVFVDMLKELPLTMILRPANFETLATTAFSLAKEARIHECAVPSLLIIALGMLGLWVFNRFLQPVVGRHG